MIPPRDPDNEQRLAFLGRGAMGRDRTPRPGAEYEVLQAIRGDRRGWAVGATFVSDDVSLIAGLLQREPPMIRLKVPPVDPEAIAAREAELAALRAEHARLLAEVAELRRQQS